VVGCCETLGSIKRGEFLDSLSECWLLKDSALWSWLVGWLVGWLEWELDKSVLG
jgi:hypothetical protein